MSVARAWVRRGRQPRASDSVASVADACAFGLARQAQPAWVQQASGQAYASRGFASSGVAQAFDHGHETGTDDEHSTGESAARPSSGAKEFHVPSRWLPGLTMDPKDRRDVMRETAGPMHGTKIRLLRKAVGAACRRKE